MVIGRLADAVSRSVEDAAGSVSEAFFEPVIRLGVTGLSRSGKTVFITSLVANLIDRGRMPGFGAGARIEAAFLQPQPDDTVPRFDYEAHLGALTSKTPRWPESTRIISELRVSLRVQPSGIFGGFQSPRTVHLDIVDYPGEWLLDLALLDKSYAQWSEQALQRAESWGAAQYLEAAGAADPTSKHDEGQAKALAAAYTEALQAARIAGAYDCVPGRFLLPGDLEGSPVLTFAPLPGGSDFRRGTLGREMVRRYEAYKARVVKPFFRNHFSKIDRQIVLVDALSAIHKGPRAVEELRVAMADILSSFRPGRNGFLTSLLLGKRVDRLLFAATKADHLHHSQHDRLSAVMEALVKDARSRADFSGAKTRAMSIAALRATVEETREHQGKTLDLVRGTLLGSGKSVAVHPGELPEDPSHLLGPARVGAERWLDGDYNVMRFAAPPLTLKPGDGPPHIRLDRVADFLLSDRLG